MFPQIDESAAERLCRRKKVGLARVRRHKGKYIEADFSFPAGVQLPRFRCYYSTATDAVEGIRYWTDRIRTHGRLARELSTGHTWVAAECIQILASLGMHKPMDLLDVVREFAKAHPHGENARTLDQVRLEVVEAKRKSGRSERHLAGLDYRLRCLVTGIGDIPVTAITTKILQAELARNSQWNATTVHSAVQGWKIALNFAIRMGYLVHNPANRLELPKIIRKPPTVLSLFQVRLLLSATLFSDRDPRLPKCRAFLAIGIFAGIRPEELVRMHWSHVDLETMTITVPAANAKDGELRYVDISANLAAWLRPIIKKRGKVLTLSKDNALAACRTVLGLSAWPSDVMRHTFVSFHFAMHRNEAEAKQQVGHRDDGRIFYNNYCKPIPRYEAVVFWVIFPPLNALPCYTPGWAEQHPPIDLVKVA